VIRFVPFDARLDRSSFRGGKPELDEWFHRFAGQQERRNTVRTTIGLDHPSRRVAAFYSLVTAQVDRMASQSSGDDRLSRYPLHAVLIARLAVDTDFQHAGVGRQALLHALRRLAGVAQSVGFEAVVVDAIDAEAADFYRRHDYVDLGGEGRRLAMSTGQLLATFATSMESD
jgi:GNAT superfamily N-acetyltransferase